MKFNKSYTLQKTGKCFLIFIALSMFLHIFAKADNQQDSLLNVVQTLSSDKDKGLTFNLISDKYLDIDLDKSIEYAHKALESGKNCNHPEIMAEANNLLANAWFYKGNNDSALVFFMRSYKYFAIGKDDHQIAAALNRIGIAYEALGKYNRAMDYYLEAIDYYQKSSDNKGLADIYNNIGIVNHSLFEYIKAIEYYNKSLKAYMQINDKAGMANALNNIGTIYHDREIVDSALFYSKKALKLYVELGKYSEITACFNNIGIVYAEIEKYDSSMYYYNKSLEISKKRGDNKRMATSLKQIAAIHISRNNYSEAKELLEQSLKIFQVLNDPAFESNTLKDLSEVSYKMQDYKKSLEYYTEYTKVKDSLFTEEMYSKVSELQIKYETSEKNKKIILLENEANTSKHQKELLLSQKKLLIWILVGITFIVIISLFAFRTRIKLLRRNRDFFQQKDEIQRLALEKNEAENNLLKQEIRKREEMSKLKEDQYRTEMELKIQNLVTASINIQNKNMMLRSIRDSVKQIIKDTESPIKKDLQKLDKEININMHLESDWEELKLHFEEVNSGFLDKLQFEFKNLTKNDLKLCTYLKLKISTKEIAQMLNISVEGVNKSRQRLKKKLNLPKDQSLTAFIENYME